MDTDDVIKRIIILTLLLMVVPFTNPTRAIALLTYFILLLMIILLSMSQIEGLNGFISENLLERGVWLAILICGVLIFAMRLLSY